MRKNQSLSLGCRGSRKSVLSQSATGSKKRSQNGSSTLAKKKLKNSIEIKNKGHSLASKKARSSAAIERIKNGSWFYKGSAWTEDEDALLGKAPDSETAEILKRSRGSVVGRRHYLGIKSFRKPGRLEGEKKPWAEHKKGKRVKI